MRTDTLTVPGATLYYEVRGAGPTLLLICGGVYDAAGYAGLAQRLADRYTVVTYDRRGNSRSPLTGPPAPQQVEEHAEDARRILAAVGAESALVFGNSSGASIGLELVARHPELVRVLVAHEPPVFDLLDDRRPLGGPDDRGRAGVRPRRRRGGRSGVRSRHAHARRVRIGRAPSSPDAPADEPERIPGGAEARPTSIPSWPR